LTVFSDRPSVAATSAIDMSQPAAASIDPTSVA
jgi:hypothetical protein